MANTTAIKIARDHCLGRKTRRRGVWGHTPIAVYASVEVHYSIEKAVDLVGIGDHYLRRIPVDSHFRINIPALSAQIEADIAQGIRCAAIVGIAGTTNTGTIDPLNELADIAKRYHAWFHVDAAYGGAAAILPEKTELFKGMARADSITIDPHKWFSIPFEGAALLVKNLAYLKEAFHVEPHYYTEQGHGSDQLNYFQMSLQGSRSFKALKIWMAFKHLGMSGYRELLRRSLQLTNQLASELAADPDFEVFHTPDLSILCFRAYPSVWRANNQITSTDVDTLNHQIHHDLERDGRFWISITRLTGHGVALRVNFQNYRTQAQHLAELLSLLRHLKDSAMQSRML